MLTRDNLHIKHISPVEYIITILTEVLNNDPALRTRLQDDSRRD